MYEHYCRYIYSVGEKPMGMKKFGRELAEWYEDGFDSSGKTRVWKNVDIVNQSSLEGF